MGTVVVIDPASSVPLTRQIYEFWRQDVSHVLWYEVADPPPQQTNSFSTAGVYYSNGQPKLAVVRDATKRYAELLDAYLPAGPDKTYALRKVREIGMWANVTITREADGAPRT